MSTGERRRVGAAPGLAAAALVLGTPGSALALPTGGLFAGPARMNGASGYYNPAALAELDTTFGALVETGLITGDVSYLRAGTSPFDGQPFEPAGFSLLAPTLDFAFVLPTFWDRLTWGLTGFAASAAASDWPEGGPQEQHGTEGLALAYAVVTGPILKLDSFGLSAMVGPVYTQASLRYGIDFGAFANDSAGAPLFTLEDPALMGYVESQTSGWSLGASLGAWWAPASWLRFGAGFLWVDTPNLEGDLRVEPPPAFEATFPNQRFRIGSRVNLDYVLPWTLNLEAEVGFAGFAFAAFFQFQNKSARDINTYILTEVEPDILDAVQLSVVNGQDDWQLGARLSYLVDPALEVGVRFDVDPLALPRETIYPINLDFTSYELAAGAQWQIHPALAVTGTYAFVYVPDLVIEESIFDITAPAESGFQRPSANGTYQITAMKFLLSLRASFGS